MTMFAPPYPSRRRPGLSRLHAVASGVTRACAWVLLSLAAVFSHDALSRDTQPAGTEPVQAHARFMDSRATFTGGMFPRLDWQSRGRGDVDFVAGRFPFGIRSGYVLRDDLTAVGLTTTHIQTTESSAMRLTGLWAVEHSGVSGITPDASDVNLLGLLAEGEFSWGLLTVGVARTFAGTHRNRGVGGGAGGMADLTGGGYPAHTDLSRYVDPVPNKYQGGYLLAVGYSTEVGIRRDILYANSYWTDGDFRRPASSGRSPLGPAGTSFSDPGTGGHRHSLSPRRLDSTGFTVGMRTFFAAEAANWAVELGHRQHLDPDHIGSGDTGGTALTTRAQYRLTDRFLLQLDAYYAIDGPDPENLRHRDAENGKDSSALRVELRVSF